jgi:ABC-type lipoprotein release transport system permease subunit
MSAAIGRPSSTSIGLPRDESWRYLSPLRLRTARFVGALLYQVEARDPVTLVSAAATLAAIGAIAAALPAYRASRIDPAVVLREGQA